MPGILMPDEPGGRRPRPFLAVGLTGGIASGKNLVAGYLEKEGIPVIDADPIGHELIQPGGPCYRPVVELFGPGVVEADGRIDRECMAQVVFADPARRQALNALLHPPILQEAERRARSLHERGGHPIVAVSAALLVEAGAAGRFDRVVLVACRPQVQLRRLRRRDGLTLEQARARLEAQLTDAERRQAAHFVIDNSGSPAATRAQTRRVARALGGLAHRRGLCNGAPAGTRPRKRRDSRRVGGRRRRRPAAKRRAPRAGRRA